MLHVRRWPHVGDVWTAYLTSFVQRYAGSKLERARDLFEQASSPPPSCLGRARCLGGCLSSCLGGHTPGVQPPSPSLPLSSWLVLA